MTFLAEQFHIKHQATEIGVDYLSTISCYHNRYNKVEILDKYKSQGEKNNETELAWQ